MTQKLIIGTLAILIIGVVSFGIYTALASSATATEEVVVNPPYTNQGSNGIQSQSGVTREPQVMAGDTVGDVWNAEGTITVLEDFGFTLELADSSTVYVELGPPDYWQAQDIALAEGDMVQVLGWNNGEQIHARIVTTNNGDLTLRSETSQPLWAGGATNEQGQHDNTGTNQSTFQVAPEDWVTLTGTISTVSNGALSMQTADGIFYSLQMGQPNFWQSQGVTLSIGDEIEVLGFWMNEQFMVGDITKTATGEHIILRDPNGRQLWGGPGRNGNSSSQATAVGE